MRTLIYEAVRHYRAGLRSGSAKTKTRHEVSGSGKKLWKQKGTGRARMGSIRSPLWRHGGTVHGPVPRSYAYKLPRKMALGALRSALSAKLRDGELKVVQAFDMSDHKTKSLVQSLRALEAASKVLLVDVIAYHEDGELTGAERNLTLASRNLQGVKLVPSPRSHGLRLACAQAGAAFRSGSPEALGGASCMNVYEVIRRPIVTEKAVLRKDEASALCALKSLRMRIRRRLRPPFKRCSASRLRT